MGKQLQPTVRRTVWIDGSGGAAGDMLAAMWLDLGLSSTKLRDALRSLPLEGWTMRARRVDRCGLSARRVTFGVPDGAPARHLKDVRRLLRQSSLDRAVKKRALAIFTRLFEAEARVHGSTAERVHLHEAGAVDAVLDIVSSAFAIEALGIERVLVSPLTTGFGCIDCAHGSYPVPGPATVELLRGVPATGGAIEAERLTPTGAAILVALADDWGPMPPMTIARQGWGAGKRDFETAPNVVRGVLGTTTSGSGAPTVHVLRCTLDDMTPQAIAYTIERCLKAGALDATVQPITMKKGRSGHRVEVLCRAAQLDALVTTLLRETRTLGLRIHEEQRVELERQQRKVKTPWGVVRLKVGYRDGKALHGWPEYEDCAKLAARNDVPLIDVQQAALAAWDGE